MSLTIDNSAGLLPIDFSEVTITRTLFRTGESEYAINRVPCRLLDIQELLSDTGVGRQQHVIVSQGNLDAILNSRPEERRLVIEEAAGVLKFRRRKERAERRLESTEASLVRLQDLLREVRRQLRPAREAGRGGPPARRRGRRAGGGPALPASGASWPQSRPGWLRRGATGSSCAVAKSRSTGALSRLDADVLFAEGRLQASLAAQGGVDLAEMVSRAEGLRARSSGLAAVIAERRRSLERAMAATVDESLIASLEAESAALADQLAETDAEAHGLLPQADELAAAENEMDGGGGRGRSGVGSRGKRPRRPGRRGERRARRPPCRHGAVRR